MSGKRGGFDDVLMVPMTPSLKKRIERAARVRARDTGRKSCAQAELVRVLVADALGFKGRVLSLAAGAHMRRLGALQ